MSNEYQWIQSCSEGIAKSPILAWIWRSRPSKIGSTEYASFVTVQPSVIASGFCEALSSVLTKYRAIPIVVGSNHCEAISESAVGDCFGTKNRASQ